MRALRRLFPLFVILSAAAWAATTSSAHPAHPTARDQALKDGCLRSNFGTGFNTAPEWVYVHRNPAIRTAHGVVRIAHQSMGDSILQHRSFDFNANLVPAARYRYLIAGSPSGHTNNYSADRNDEEHGRLHFEWESATLPFFAWPTDGDRAMLWGRWIWDCGHWTTGSQNNTGGTLTGEHSELHPLNGIVVQRHSPFLAKRRETQTDVFISNMGDGAHAVEQCALSHHPQPGASYPQYDAGFRPCASNPANRLQPLARSYKFFVPAPPHRPAGATLRYRIVNRIRGGSGRQHVRKLRNGIEVTVKLRGAKHVVRYGKTFFVSWSGPQPTPVKLRVTLKSILIKRADPNPAVPDPSGAHWTMYIDVNGYWQLINKWAPKLTTHVTDGEQIAVNRTVTIRVPRGGRVWFQVSGRECDEPAGKVVLGIYANLLYPCPANTDEQNPNVFAIFANDDPGLVLDTYRSPAAALGKHTRTSAASTNKFPHSGQIDLGVVHGQGNGNYQLTYTVRRG
jgi:hypothetical protein